MMFGGGVNSGKHNKITTRQQQQAKRSKFISFLMLIGQCILEDL